MNRHSYNFWLRGLFLIGCTTVAASIALGQFKEAPEGGFPPPSGQIAFVRNQNRWVMNADGSNARELYASGGVSTRVTWSPDNQEILFCQEGLQQYQLPGGGGGRIKLYDIFATRVAGGGIKKISNDAISASPSYFPDGQRMAFTRNLNALSITEEVPLFQVFVGGVYGSPEPANLNQGKVTTQLQLMSPDVSPDGERIACTVTDQETLTSPRLAIGIAIFPAEGFKGTVLEWTDNARKLPNAASPAWSPDGRYLAYVDLAREPRGLAIYDVERESRRTLVQPLAGFSVSPSTPSWSPDGNWIVFANIKGSIQIVDRNGKNLKPLTNAGTDAYPAFSHP